MLNDFFLWRCDPTRVMASSFLRFPNYTQRRTTVGRTPLDEWSARRRDFYLTAHNTHNRETSMTLVGFEPTISAGERPQTSALDRAATGTGILKDYTWETDTFFLTDNRRRKNSWKYSVGIKVKLKYPFVNEGCEDVYWIVQHWGNCKKIPGIQEFHISLEPLRCPYQHRYFLCCLFILLIEMSNDIH
jgi:hypothetical protein